MAKTRTKKPEPTAIVGHEAQLWQRAELLRDPIDIIENQQECRVAGSSTLTPSIRPTPSIFRSEMVFRTARKDSNTGIEFWGSSRFPSC
jgi:hypothetical protein